MGPEDSYQSKGREKGFSHAILSRLGSSFPRATLVGSALLLWLVLPLSLLRLELGSSQYPFLNFILGVWFVSVAFNALPATGVVAGIIGLFSRDRLVSFLVGFLPNVTFVLLEIMFAGPSSEEFSHPLGYGVWETILGLAYGLIGLGTALYSTWEKSPMKAGQRTFRQGALFVFFGLFLWFIVAWGPTLGLPRS